jgi:hypothetical protein
MADVGIVHDEQKQIQRQRARPPSWLHGASVRAGCGLGVLGLQFAQTSPELLQAPPAHGLFLVAPTQTTRQHIELLSLI